jgi:hypothetical protein
MASLAISAGSSRRMRAREFTKEVNQVLYERARP